MSTHTDPAADPFSGVENVYVLSPVQFGMVFHDLYSPDSGAYLNQYVFSLRGRLDPRVLRQAWEHVLLHCPVLRTAVVWEGVAQPVQVVFRRAALPWEAHDWRGSPGGEQQAQLHRFLEGQRGSRFDLLRPPLMRLALLQLGDEAFELVWSYHHVLLDGWSISLVLQDVLTCYDSLRRGSVPVLPRRRPYHDYIAWLQRQDLSAAEAYWRSTLEGFISPTPLGVDRAPGVTPAGQTAFGTTERHLSVRATGGLRAFAKQHRLTVNTLVQGAWGLLLSRYSGEEDVVFGATVAGRPPGMAGMEAMVGLFINTLPVRLRVEGWRRMDGWLRQLQTEQLDARAYEYSPLPEVRRWSEVPAGVPLFESIVAFENHPIEEMEGGGARGFAVVGWSRSGQGHYPLALLVLPGERTSLQLEYDGVRIAAEAAERMMGHLEAVLEVMVAGPAQRLSEVSLLRDSERIQVLEAWNDTVAVYPQACIHELVSMQAARTPDSIAVVFEGGSLTYTELEMRSNRLAHHLRRLGVGAEVRVGVCAERSAELVVALLGTLKAGGAYVPLDPSYPAERLAFMLRDARPPVLLTRAGLSPGLPAGDAAVLCLDRDADRIEAESAAPLAQRVDPDALAYVIYTSGSTGRPKGAMNAHRGVVNRLLWMQEAYGLDASDAVLQKTPFSFDVSVWELFWPLLAGARLVLARPGGHRDPAYLAEVVERECVTTLHFVPPMLDAFLEGAEVERCGSVRRVVCSGEALPWELTERFFAALPRAELHNLYGPTEAAVDVTYHACGSEAGRVVPIGRPVANTRVYVLDREMNALPAGVPGELYIGGVQVGRGYLGRAGLTAERFVPDPYGAAGGRLYRTGDRARWLHAGEVEYLGRTDHQVKVRGFRIEPGEIEAALREHTGVREATVVAREDGPGDRRLVAYLALDGGAGATSREVQAYLAERLPEHMVPSAVVLLERLPLNANGKIDRSALPPPEWGAASPYVAPRTAAEEVLSAIWAEVLGVERVGVEENF
ncbi:MAG TPA: amino acid adenylation domain-containing protein, partial [Longimicrobiaceae bacterium]|nr:amino acid adenylation domain-containing protein [Longimicrobiaceae bacterium]